MKVRKISLTMRDPEDPADRGDDAETTDAIKSHSDDLGSMAGKYRV